MTTAISAIIVFLLVIMIHELGHFLVAKSVGIKVNEFSIGMGPQIFQKQKEETKYSLRLIPIGGYVSMEGEDEDSNDPRSFTNASIGKKLGVLVAGALMNFILAIVILIIVFYNLGIPNTEVGNIIEDSPAFKSELEVGDRILAVDGKEVQSWNDISTAISETKAEEDLSLLIKRDSKEKEIKIRTVYEEGRTIIGIQPGADKSFLKSIKMSFVETKNIIVQMFKVIGMLITGKLGKDVAIAGPVGVISQIGQAAEMGIFNLLLLLALISINLGFFNLLPIPALDGGRIFFLLIEAVRGKPMDPEKEGMVHVVGFILLMGLMLIVTYKDIVKLIFKR